MTKKCVPIPSITVDRYSITKWKLKNLLNQQIQTWRQNLYLTEQASILIVNTLNKTNNAFVHFSILYGFPILFVALSPEPPCLQLKT